jgi:hypothetical protein
MTPSLDDLIATVAALPVPPVAFEAFWDGDTNGWWLDLSAIVPQTGGYATVFLRCLQGGDTRSFSAQAQELGGVLAARFGLPFYFPSPDHPEDNCPRWWQQDQGTPCRRCGIPLLQRPDHRWPGICSHCHLAEEHERREAAWTAEQRAGPRCDTCGTPSLPDSATTIHCPQCRERYRLYQCRGCGEYVRGFLNGEDNLDDADGRCRDCVIADRLAGVPDNQREAIYTVCVTKGPFSAAKIVQQLLGGSFDDAVKIAYFLLQALDSADNDEP